MTNVELKKMIVEELKKNGLDIAEDMAVSAVKVLLGLIPKVVAATDNKIDDLILAILPLVEPKIMEVLDRIDGEADIK